MASLPPQPADSQRHSPESTPQLRRSSVSQSATSVDSQTVLLNNPQPTQTGEASGRSASVIGKPEPSPSIDPRKCWICFADETEDTPESSPWRSPCPCALTAHESCLLDWAADVEAPAGGGRSQRKLVCPQCKAEIVVARPRSPLVQTVRVVDKTASRLVVPGLLLTLAGSLWTGAVLHGVTTLYLVFGKRDFARLMANASQGPEGRLSARWLFGLPMIPFLLILSRTSLAEGILPSVPILLFTTAVQVNRDALQPSSMWPPSATMAFSLLPFLRGLYNEAYRRLFAQKELQWFQAVQPRAAERNEGDNAPAPEQNQEAAGEDAENGIGFELNLEVEIVEEVEEVEEAPRPGQHNRLPAQQLDLQNANGNDNEPREAGQQAAAPPHPAPILNRPNQLIVSTSRAADTIMGALSFPLIASIMGSVIKRTLPNSWTTTSSQYGSARPGLLQSKWGRTLVGGCLFVVMKDTLILYARYRVAKNHGQRRILNYDREKKRVVR